ncbi:hypothetical protein [Pseudodesulfovibrio tunisiensis]|uniref:hypothetical protein n=1 Tax=Pseudodesulfovibrio tunisiensis TaxID=463192 RepID=UPI001FB373CE|nr:hypothetical protein [Pseudodesulfovibrio tunisiensis]
MKAICPKAMVWHKIHQKLNIAWERKGGEGERPPIPLILAGWAYSDDYEKAIRWRQTVEWAENNSLADIIPELTDEDWYYG